MVISSYNKKILLQTKYCHWTYFCRKIAAWKSCYHQVSNILQEWSNKVPSSYLIIRGIHEKFMPGLGKITVGNSSNEWKHLRCSKNNYREFKKELLETRISWLSVYRILRKFKFYAHYGIIGFFNNLTVMGTSYLNMLQTFVKLLHRQQDTFSKR